MSLLLLKKSVDILEQESSLNTSKGTKSKQKDEARVITGKQKQKKKNHKNLYAAEQSKNLNDIRQEMKQGTQKSNENLRRLLALSKNTLKSTDAEKIVKRAHRGRYVQMELPKVEKESIFTDEDFRAFEEEYFHS